MAGRTIFEDWQDRGVFYGLVEKQVLLGRIVVFAYVLMTNHFHLLLMSPTGELDLAMRDILRAYVLIFNPRRDRDGPLFKSRFGSKPVSTMDYRRRVLWYIDRNPVAAKVVERSIEYPHGSAYHFHHGTAPMWLNTSWAASVLEESRGIVGMPKGTYGVGGAAIHGLENDQLVEARFRAFGSIDPLDRELSSSEQRDRFLGDYFSRRVLTPDGLDRELPVAAEDAVLRACREMAPGEVAWGESTPRGPRDIRYVATAGLLRRMAGCGVDAIARHLGIGRTTAARYVAEHEDRLVRDPGYGARIHDIAHTVLWEQEPC